MDLIRQMRSYIRVIELDALRQVEEGMCCGGVSITQCHLLLEIEAAGKSINELAEVLHLDKSTLSRTVDSLVKAGIVRRSEQEDRRYVLVELTDTGKELAGSINTTCDSFYRKVLEQIPVNRHRTIVNALEDISEAVKKVKFNPGACCIKKAER